MSKLTERISIRCSRIDDSLFYFGYELNVVNFSAMSRICDRIIRLIEEEKRMGTVVVEKERKFDET